MKCCHLLFLFSVGAYSEVNLFSCFLQHMYFQYDNLTTVILSGGKQYFLKRLHKPTPLTASPNFYLNGVFSSHLHRLTCKMELRSPKWNFKIFIQESKLKIPQTVIELLPDPGTFMTIALFNINIFHNMSEVSYPKNG